MNDRTPEWFGELLRTKARYAKNTCERKDQISRVDAVCWFLCQVKLASARDVKRFMTAFKGKVYTYRCRSRRLADGSIQSRFTKVGLEPAYAMLNTAYGGVGMGFEGRLRTCMTGSHYGPVSPLYRPIPRHYAVTIGGIKRAERVQKFLNSKNVQS